MSVLEKENLEKEKNFVKSTPKILRKIAKCNRYKNAILKNYKKIIDINEEEQFAAIEILTDDGFSFISYRGTDNTIIGWKEDFKLSYQRVPAEEEAIEYLSEVGRGNGKRLRLGGHSKGGHLAIYSALGTKKRIRKKIDRIYDFDGPGFEKDLLKSDEMKEIELKIQRYVPEFSVVGMLFEHIGYPIVVKSSEKGIIQHDAFSWQLMGKKFEIQEDVSEMSKIFDKSFSSWLENMDKVERKEFVTDFFGVLEAPGVDSLLELQNMDVKNLGAMIVRLNQVDSTTKQRILNLIGILFKKIVDNLKNI